MAMLWWRRKEAEIRKGTCTINTWEQFREDFKKAFFLNNVIYEAKRKFRELKQMGSVRAYVQEFTTLTLQIPNLTDDDMLFHFMDGLQNWAKTELERRQVRTIDEAITQAEALTDFRQEKPNRARAEEMRGSHDHGGEIVAKARSSGHIPRSMTPISLMARSLDVMATRRGRQRLPTKVVATYAAGRMVMQGALN
ncbi:hypothetical protein KY285_008572 [Solanum tuberosum]|nr:hypothetical protein KY285_008572 [Solanum tuberosum]